VLIVAVFPSSQSLFSKQAILVLLHLEYLLPGLLQ
jgi:hypothetical protein